MRLYLIAGEASGDLHGANLIKALKSGRADLEFRFYGGDLMAAEAGDPIKHYREMAFMGFTEVLLNLRTILGNIKACKQDIFKYKPDAVVLIDYPGFNMRIAAFAKSIGIKVIYYISPQVWAWKENRVKKLKATVDLMLVILPFEKDFYARHGMEVEFTGHPLLDALPNSQSDRPAARNSNLIALFPGSRKQEVNRILPIMLSIIPNFPGLRFVVAGAPGLDADFYAPMLLGSEAELVFNHSRKLFLTAACGPVTSGTATLEGALCGMPQVVCYKGGRLSYQIAKLLIKVKFISLVNLIADREVVQELIQNDLNTVRLTAEISKLLDPARAGEINVEYARIRQLLGGPGASARAATAMLKIL